MTVEQQAELFLSRRPNHAAIPPQLIAAQKSSSAALSLSCQASGLEDKEIYVPLGIDAGHWSRIKKGEAHFPLDHMDGFCRLVGNTALPEWIAHQIGCELVMLKSEAERRADEAEARAKVAEEKARLLAEILAGRAV